MSTDLKHITKLKEQVESLQREADRSEGALEGVMSRLKDEFGCETIEDAEALLKEMKKKLRGTEERLDAEVEGFEKKWGKVLQE